MELHDKMGYNKAIVVDECMLIDLDKCIKHFFTSLPCYSADLLDESTINFESLDELLQYDNFGSKAIKFLKVDFGFSNRLVFKQTISVVHSYEYSLTIEYVTNNMDDSTLFKKEMFKIFEKGKRPWYYTFVTKFSIIYFFGAFIFLIAIFYGILYLGGMLEIKDTSLSVNLYNKWIIYTISIFVIRYLLSQIRKVLFSVIAYKIGEQKKKIEQKDDLISKFFWGVIVTGIVSVVISILI